MTINMPAGTPAPFEQADRKAKRRGGRTTILRNASQIVTMASHGRPKRGPDLDDPGVVTGAAIAMRDGVIVGIGSEDQLGSLLDGESPDILDAEGGIVLPGFVDPHTHLVFVGSRPRELETRLTTGRSFVDFVKEGGGSLDTVRLTRAASDAELADLIRLRLRRMAEWGTTTAEVKSGYGLTVPEEVRHLRILAGVAPTAPISLVSTALPAHYLPIEKSLDPSDYVDQICDEMIPLVASEKLATSFDAFHDPTGYTTDQVRRMVRTAHVHGLGGRVHADQLVDGGGAALAADLGALSADHLGHISEAGIDALARSDTVAVLIPGSLLFVPGEKVPPVRDMVERGVVIALSTDYNPGTSPIAAMPLAITLGCVLFKLSVAEALAAATINAAFALQVANRVGSLEVGKQADLVLYEAKDYREIAYRFGENLVRAVIVGGETVVRRPAVGPL
jgi:imidazolonepropionase